jgi:hypothetical protein
MQVENQAPKKRKSADDELNDRDIDAVVKPRPATAVPAVKATPVVAKTLATSTTAVVATKPVAATVAKPTAAAITTTVATARRPASAVVTTATRAAPITTTTMARRPVGGATTAATVTTAAANALALKQLEANKEEKQLLEAERQSLQEALTETQTKFRVQEQALDGQSKSLAEQTARVQELEAQLQQVNRTCHVHFSDDF